MRLHKRTGCESIEMMIRGGRLYFTGQTVDLDSERWPERIEAGSEAGGRGPQKGDRI